MKSKVTIEPVVRVGFSVAGGAFGVEHEVDGLGVGEVEEAVVEFGDGAFVGENHDSGVSHSAVLKNIKIGEKVTSMMKEPL